MDLKKIIHIDMDAYYASIEQRDNPEFRGKPLIVGGLPNTRGVVSTCSYEARKFGIHSAMSSNKAFKLCPQAIFTRPRMNIYKKTSEEIIKIFHQYTELVEPLSLDEAFLDVTKNKKNIASATIIAQNIKNEIFKQTSLTASAGISYNKFLAKIASDYNKPNGITVVTPEKAILFISKLPIRKFFGIGKVTETKMHKLGIKIGKDLQGCDINLLINNFGKSGEIFYNIARGIDHREVNPTRIRKSLGREITLSKDINDKKQIIEILSSLVKDVESHLNRYKLKGKTITLKIKFYDFKTITRSITVEEACSDHQSIMQNINNLLRQTNTGEKLIRLLGVSLSNFYNHKKDNQLKFPF